MFSLSYWLFGEPNNSLLKISGFYGRFSDHNIGVKPLQVDKQNS